jgi:hypothetical protein
MKPSLSGESDLVSTASEALKIEQVAVILGPNVGRISEDKIREAYRQVYGDRAPNGGKFLLWHRLRVVWHSSP